MLSYITAHGMGLCRRTEAGVPAVSEIFSPPIPFLWQYGFADHKKLLESLLDQPRLAPGDGESALGFQRRVSPGNPKLTESLCTGCSSFVAASKNPALLDLAEKIHICASSKIINPPSGISVP
jgi:hypothetical protein